MQKFTLLFLVFFTLGLQAQDRVDHFPGDGVKVVRAFPNLQFDNPVYFTHAPDGSNKVFVVEKSGIIKIFDNDDATSTTEVFLDIQSKVQDAAEMGLLGLAFDPNYKTSRLFYVYYSSKNPHRSILARYKATTDGSKALDAAQFPPEVLLELSQPANNHNGGMIEFGPDGMLYVALGDGGRADDFFRNGQDKTTQLGSILRIDANGTGAGPNGHYGIPTNNPFANSTSGEQSEIYIYGARNPWRFSFDLKSKSLWVADVGQGDFEEINVVDLSDHFLQPGPTSLDSINLGWNAWEGFMRFDPKTVEPADHHEPIHVYDRSDLGGKSVTGGYVYRGTKTPALVGKYIYGDFLSGNVWALEFDPFSWSKVKNQRIDKEQILISSFGQDAEGEVYFMNYQAPEGFLWRFIAE